MENEMNNDTQANTKGGLNFIAVKMDPVDKVISVTLAWGLGIAILLVLVIMGMSVYKYSLQQKLNTLNAQIEQAAAELQEDEPFVNEFLAVQEKLDRYDRIDNNEKMVDLFPILSALVPETVQVKNLTIEPDRVEIVCFAVDQSAQALFASNLRLADGQEFDGQKLKMENLTIQEVAKTTDINYQIEGYGFSLSFNYSIE
ncbi:hypothetical protein IJJ27_00525 [bacterium]|nr:hypothetical protein [bacterium]